MAEQNIPRNIPVATEEQMKEGLQARVSLIQLMMHDSDLQKLESDAEKLKRFHKSTLAEKEKIDKEITRLEADLNDPSRDVCLVETLEDMEMVIQFKGIDNGFSVLIQKKNPNKQILIEKAKENLYEILTF
nr:hypothetical protein CFP56_34127 [Quercus suber]